MATRRKKLKKLIRQNQQKADAAIGTSVDAFNLNDQLPTREDLLGGLSDTSNLAQGQYANAFNQGLQQVGDVARQGWTDADRAALEAGQRQIQRDARNQTQGIMSEARARGMGGSGMEMLGSMVAQQGAANRGADLAAQMGQAGRDRAYGAAQQMAGMAQGQGSALDAFNQQLAGARGGAAQQQWGNQFGLAGAQSGANANAAGYYGQQAQQGQQQLQQMNQALWGGVQGAIGSIAPMVGAIKGAGGTPPPQQGWASGTYRGTPGGGR